MIHSGNSSCRLPALPRAGFFGIFSTLLSQERWHPFFTEKLAELESRALSTKSDHAIALTHITPHPTTCTPLTWSQLSTPTTITYVESSERPLTPYTSTSGFPVPASQPPKSFIFGGFKHETPSFLIQKMKIKFHIKLANFKLSAHEATSSKC